MNIPFVPRIHENLLSVKILWRSWKKIKKQSLQIIENVAKKGNKILQRILKIFKNHQIRNPLSKKSTNVCPSAHALYASLRLCSTPIPLKTYTFNEWPHKEFCIFFLPEFSGSLNIQQPVWIYSLGCRNMIVSNFRDCNYINTKCLPFVKMLLRKCKVKEVEFSKLKWKMEFLYNTHTLTHIYCAYAYIERIIQNCKV